MDKILKLLRLQIDNSTDMLKTKSKKKMATAVLRVLLLILGVAAAAFLIFFRIFLLGFNINAELVAIGLAALQAVSLIFAVGTVIGTLYLKRDNEMLICLPVTPNQLFISKMILIYLHEVFFNLTISLPILLCLGIQGGFGASYFLALPLYVLLLPAFPLFLASILSIPTMALLKFFKKHVYLAIVVMLLLAIVILWGYIDIVGKVAENFNIATKQVETVTKFNNKILSVGKQLSIYFYLASAMLSFSKWYYIAIFFGICAVVMTVTILITRPIFFKIAMSSLENDLKIVSNKKFTKRSAFTSLILKEIRTIFRSPGYIFEYFLFAFLMPFIVFSYDMLLGVATVNEIGVNMISGAHLMVVAILAMLSNVVSASVVSREGGNFYISKIIPINYFTQMAAKLTFNAIFTLSAILITAVISCFIYPVWQVILGSIAVMIASVGHIAMSMEMDIKNPVVNFGGDEDTDALKKNTVKSMVIGLAIGLIMGIFIMLMATSKMQVLSYILLIVISLIYCVRCLYTLVLRIHMQYDKIEL